jgi:hypothetical protein
LVELVDGRPPSARFVPLDDVRWQHLELPVDGLSSIEALQGAILDGLTLTAEAEPELAHVARVTLTGRGPLVPLLRQGATLEALEASLRERLGSFSALESLRVAAVAPVDVAQLLAAGGFMAELAPALSGELAPSELEAVLQEPELVALAAALARVRSDALERLTPRLVQLGAARALDALEEVSHELA